jgi:hypothetical protein
MHLVVGIAVRILLPAEPSPNTRNRARRDSRRDGETFAAASLLIEGSGVLASKRCAVRHATSSH